MLIRIPRGWELPSGEATPESIFLDRRRFLKVAAVTGIAAAVPAGAQEPQATTAPAVVGKRPSGNLYPAKRNELFTLDRPLSEEAVVARSNIFDEFGLERERIWEIAAGFQTTPWKIHIGGTVEKQNGIDVDELVRQLGIEERL